MKKVIPQKKAVSLFKGLREAVDRIAIAIEDRKWDRSFARSQDVLQRLGDEALAEHRAGRTRPIDPDCM